MKAKLFFVAMSLSLTTQALEESSLFDEMVARYQTVEYCDDAPQEYFWKRIAVATPMKAYEGPLTYKLRYSKFGCTLGRKGALVIAPGRAEGSPEYYETAVDFIKNGYSPVYVIDHRGQGLSPRILENSFKSHVDDFMNYVSDLDYAVEDILDDLKGLGFNPGKTPLMYASNSMGGGIGLGYFHKKGNENPFSAAAILGSMIRVNYLSFIEKDPSLLNNMIYSEAGVIAQGKLNCLTKKKCARYARPEVFGDYQPGSRQFIMSDDINEMEKFMTHSKARYDLKTYLWDNYDWSQIKDEEYDENENWRGLQLGGSTFSWTLTTTKFLKKMKSKRFIKKLPSMPFLILTGTRDLRAYKPYKDGTTDLSRHSGYCSKINEFNRHSRKLCTFVPLTDSFHEIFKESDEYRNKGLKTVLDFFDKNRL
jgi:lysophospholipase